MKNIHFISGLPRSGSTLLSAILSQNPDFHASISSPLAHIFNGAWAAMGGGNEGSVFIDDAQRQKILHSIVNSFYGFDFSEFTVFDTSRIWTAKTHILFRLFPDAKMICCVRNVAWIIDSLERITRKNWLSPSRMFPPDNSMSVYERVNALVSAKGMIGSSYNAMREACFGEFNNRILLLTYDRLVADPVKCIIEIYDFIGIEIPPNKLSVNGREGIHDLNNITFPSGTEDAITEFDARLNTPGLHSVRKKIERIERASILPPDIFQAHSQSNFWDHPEFRRTGVRVL